jgi:hypothetical protein
LMLNGRIISWAGATAICSNGLKTAYNRSRTDLIFPYSWNKKSYVSSLPVLSSPPEPFSRSNSF